MQKKLMAEGFGTFALALAVLLSVTAAGDSLIVTPVIAGLVLGLFVYSIGHTSGCHINPAVTVGLWSLGKMNAKDAVSYVVAQLIGGLLALLLVSLVSDVSFSIGIVPESNLVFIAELVGTTLFTFGIASVVYGKTPAVVSGLVIGGSLLLGILTAAHIGSLGLLNPAVALAVGSLSVSYIAGALIGSMVGMWLYKKICV